MAKIEALDISNKRPRSPITSLPQHLGDYGFDPHINYFQASEETRKNKRETRSTGALHFKEQKPISKMQDSKKRLRRWWRRALLFWKWKGRDEEKKPHYLHQLPRNMQAVESQLGAVYRVEPGSETPSRRGRACSRPVAGSLTPSRKEDLETRYLSLRELNLQTQQHWISAPSTPIYLVT